MSQPSRPSGPRPPQDHRDFDAPELAGRKRAEGTRVSVVIPARDEAATVGTVAGPLCDTLRDRVGLVDEVMVVDAGSTDATGRIAAEAGARVVRQAEVLPERGDAPGKGEAMWKGLAACDGDVVVYVDADVVDIGPRFVTGLLGPLLTDPTVTLVKAGYDRPLHLDSQLHPHGGGRVTELLVRPLLATFWPELARLVQPLAGEIAARRDLLVDLRFVRGYGVELAMLLDVAAAHGPESIAQVDLGRRVHVHQPLDALGRMAAELLHVAIGRLHETERLSTVDTLGTVLPQPVRDDAGRPGFTTTDIVVEQRPPLGSARHRPTGASDQDR